MNYIPPAAELFISCTRYEQFGITEAGRFGPDTRLFLTEKAASESTAERNAELDSVSRVFNSYRVIRYASSAERVDEIMRKHARFLSDWHAGRLIPEALAKRIALK